MDSETAFYRVPTCDASGKGFVWFLIFEQGRVVGCYRRPWLFSLDAESEARMKLVCLVCLDSEENERVFGCLASNSPIPLCLPLCLLPVVRVNQKT